jgi:hypothetical protein
VTLRNCVCRKDRNTLDERAQIEEEEIAIETEKQQRQVERKREATRLVVEEVTACGLRAVGPLLLTACLPLQIAREDDQKRVMAEDVRGEVLPDDSDPFGTISAADSVLGAFLLNFFVLRADEAETALEIEKWKLRELKRIQRDREERCASWFHATRCVLICVFLPLCSEKHAKEQADIARRRTMTDEEIKVGEIRSCHRKL